MGPSIAALIVISVLLTAVVVMFRANQIGATLLANATKANAERVTEIGNTKFEITSVSTSTDWYSQAEDFDPPNAFGCNRQGYTPSRIVPPKSSTSCCSGNK